MLRKRLITSLVALPPVLLLLYLGGLPLQLFLVIVFLYGNYEYFSFCGFFKGSSRLLATGLQTLPLAGFFYFGGMQGFAWGAIALALVWFIVAIVIFERKQHEPNPIELLAVLLIGYVYCALLLGQLVVVSVYPESHLALAWLLVVTVACDSFAYFGGRLIGGPRLAPRTSPKKTISGSISGFIMAIVAGLLAGELLAETNSTLSLVLWGALAAALVQVGDLAESMIKRGFRIKDSGNLMPGHGGLLDRIDGLVFAAAVVHIVPFG